MISVTAIYQKGRWLTESVAWKGLPEWVCVLKELASCGWGDGKWRRNIEEAEKGDQAWNGKNLLGQHYQELESDAAEGEGGHTEQKSRMSKWQVKYKEL